MKKLILTPVVATSIATCALFASHPSVPVTGAERASLAVAGADESLLALRAGARIDTSALGGAERTALQRAQASEPELLDLRAGMNLTRDEWIIIAIALTVILVIVVAA